MTCRMRGVCSGGMWVCLWVVVCVYKRIGVCAHRTWGTVLFDCRRSCVAALP